jgi:preprotein translocase subunit SecB
MKPAPLQLERPIFFTKIEIASHENGKPDAVNLLQFAVQIGQDVPEHSRRFQLTLKLNIQSPADSKALYTGDVHSVGIFRVAEQWPADKVQSLVEVNGVGILYGAIRELVLNLTARGPWPPLLLNAFSFVPDAAVSATKTTPALVGSKA